MIALALCVLAIGDAAPELQAEYDRISHQRRAGELRAAAQAYEALANSNPESELAQRALTTAAEIHHWNLNDLAKASALYDRVLLGRDDRRGVMPALIGRLWIEQNERGVKATLELAKTLETKTPKAEFAPWLLLHMAKLYAEELRDLSAAIALCRRVRIEHAETTYLDDAQFLEAGLLRKLKKPREALPLYGAIIDSKSTSLIVGSYNSTYLDDAYFQVAETLLLELKDEALAKKAYLELIKETPDSILVDDAQRRLKELERR